MSGTIKANNTILTKAMFMKIGCYVEQENCLWETSTVHELLTTAA